VTTEPFAALPISVHPPKVVGLVGHGPAPRLLRLSSEAAQLRINSHRTVEDGLPNTGSTRHLSSRCTLPDSRLSQRRAERIDLEKVGAGL